MLGGSAVLVGLCSCSAVLCDVYIQLAQPALYAFIWRRNYGLLPQTWEDPGHKNTECDAAVSSQCCLSVTTVPLCFQLANN